MTKSEKIITLVRQYCLELFKQGRSTHQSIADGLLRGIEFVVGKEFENIEECKSELKKEGIKNLIIRTSGYSKQGHLEVIETEKQKFFDYIDKITIENIKHVQPLNYRRRLNENEAKDVRKNLEENWNFDGGYWELLTKCSAKPFFFFDIENLEENDFERIEKILIRQNPNRIFEINEDRIDYEIDSLEFDSKSYEVIYTDKKYNSLIYISHEGTISFGGTELMKEIDKELEYKLELKNKW